MRNRLRKVGNPLHTWCDLTAKENDSLSERVRKKQAELLDHINGAFYWILDYDKRNNVQVDETMGSHIARIESLLGEICHPPSEYLANRIVTGEPTNHQRYVTQHAVTVPFPIRSFSSRSRN